MESLKKKDSNNSGKMLLRDGLGRKHLTNSSSLSPKSGKNPSGQARYEDHTLQPNHRFAAECYYVHW
ncbi:MAG: hypothetical protein HC877_00075 [Thioploca sp.]|nr:hypothetical protein [Thioploca sp.]